MEPNIVSICPRCEHELEIRDGGDSRSRVVLACPEAHCDYVLVLPVLELANARLRGAGFAEPLKRAAS